MADCMPSYLEAAHHYVSQVDVAAEVAWLRAREPAHGEVAVKHDARHQRCVCDGSGGEVGER